MITGHYYGKARGTTTVQKESPMSATAVAHYRALWDTKNNKGRIAIKFHGGNTHTIKIDNHAEFAAMVAVLQGDRGVFPETLFVDTAP